MGAFGNAQGAPGKVDRRRKPKITRPGAFDRFGSGPGQFISKGKTNQ